MGGGGRGVEGWLGSRDLEGQGPRKKKSGREVGERYRAKLLRRKHNESRNCQPSRDQRASPHAPCSAAPVTLEGRREEHERGHRRANVRSRCGEAHVRLSRREEPRFEAILWLGV